MRYLALFFASLLSLGCAALGPRLSGRDTVGNDGQPTALPELRHVEHIPGNTVQLVPQVRLESGRVRHDIEVTWRSEYPDVATVDSHGLVTLLRPGRVNILIHCDSCPTRDGSVMFFVMPPKPSVDPR